MSESDAPSEQDIRLFINYLEMGLSGEEGRAKQMRLADQQLRNAYGSHYHTLLAAALKEFEQDKAGPRYRAMEEMRNLDADRIDALADENFTLKKESADRAGKLEAAQITIRQLRILSRAFMLGLGLTVGGLLVDRFSDKEKPVDGAVSTPGKTEKQSERASAMPPTVDHDPGARRWNEEDLELLRALQKESATTSDSTPLPSPVERNPQ